jgi:hypothetical protein
MHLDNSLDGFFSDVFKFKIFEGKNVLKTIGKNPTRLLTGVDPASTRAWNAVLGTHNKAIVDQWGGTSKDTIEKARKAGINIGPGMALEQVAHVVASWYAAAGLAKAIPQGDTMLKVAEKLKSAADAHGGAGPAYATPQQDQSLAPQSLWPLNQYPTAIPPTQQPMEVSPAKLPPWAVPVGIGAAVMFAAALLLPRR